MLNNLYSNLSGDFVATANSGAKTITFSAYASSVLSTPLTSKSFIGASIKRRNSSGVVDTLPMTNVSFASNVLTLSAMSANFAAGDEVAVVLIGADKGFDEVNDWHKLTIASDEAGIAGGKLDVHTYSNISGDFTATANSGAKTITLTSIASVNLDAQLTAASFSLATIKKITSGGVVSTLPVTSVAYNTSTKVLTLANMTANFAAGDTVAVVVPGPLKSILIDLLYGENPDLDIIRTEPYVYTPTRVTGDNLLKSGEGYIHHIVVNSVTTGGTLSIYNNTAESGTAPFVFPFTTTAVPGQQILVDSGFPTGIYIGYDGTLAGAFTIVWR